MTTSLKEPVGLRERITDNDWWDPGSCATRWQTVMLSDIPPRVRERTCLLPEGELTIRTADDPPAWLDPTVESLVELLRLAPGWDSYGARAVDPMHVDAALRLLSLIMQDHTPKPSVVPTNRGGIQLEWHVQGIDLEVETLTPHRFLVSIEEPATDTEWEGELISDLGPLVDWVRRLS